MKIIIKTENRKLYIGGKTPVILSILCFDFIIMQHIKRYCVV